jgi:hypothetical protein
MDAGGGGAVVLRADLASGALARCLGAAEALAARGGGGGGGGAGSRAEAAASAASAGADAADVVAAAARELRTALGRPGDALQLCLRLAAGCGGPVGGVSPSSSPAALAAGAAADLLLEGLARAMDAPARAGAGAGDAAGAAVPGLAGAVAWDRGLARDAADGLLALPAAAAAAAASAGGAGGVLDPSSLAGRLHGLALVLAACAVYDRLAEGDWSGALDAALDAGLVPGTPREAETAWARLFDPLPTPLKGAFGAVLSAVMAAAVRAFADARRAAAAATGLPPAQAAAVALGAAPPPPGFAAAGSPALQALRHIKQRVRWGGLGGALARTRERWRGRALLLREVCKTLPTLTHSHLPSSLVRSSSPSLLQAHALVVGHSPLMRRYIPGALLSELVASDMGLA